MDTGPAPDLVARFAANLGGTADAGGIGLAVSGGPDSLALLLLVRALGTVPFAVATVDHGLRPESADEACFVADLCARFGIDHTTLRVAVGEGNLQARAREARYSALHGWAAARGLGAIATAHHADDQAETLLMRLNRGSGIAGLAGVRRESRPFGDAIRLLRPLLGWRKRELEAIVAAAGIDPVRDPSNANSEFDRVRVRQFLEHADWLDPVSVTRSVDYLGEAQDYFAEQADREWNEHIEAGDLALTYRPAAPAILRRMIVERALRHCGAVHLRGGEVARLERVLSQGGSGNLGGVLARSKDGVWSFAPEPPRS